MELDFQFVEYLEGTVWTQSLQELTLIQILILLGIVLLSWATWRELDGVL